MKMILSYISRNQQRIGREQLSGGSEGKFFQVSELKS